MKKGNTILDRIKEVKDFNVLNYRDHILILNLSDGFKTTTFADFCEAKQSEENKVKVITYASVTLPFVLDTNPKNVAHNLEEILVSIRDANRDPLKTNYAEETHALNWNKDEVYRIRKIKG